MLTRRTSSRVAVAALLLVAALGTTMWYLQPEHAAKWALSMFLIPAMWGAVTLFRRATSCAAPGESDGFLINGAIALAGLIMAIPLALKVAGALGWIDDGAGHVSDRAMGVVLGVVFMVSSNSIPKRLTPLSATPCEPTRAQTLQRFAGWTFVLAGLGYSVAWLALPIERAKLIATLILAGGVALVLVRVAYVYLRASQTPPPASDKSNG